MAQRSTFCSALFAVLLGCFLLPQPAAASPVLDDVVAGDVTINQDGSVTVITASDGAIIHFDSFDIFAGEVVRFLQPSDQARVLNRVFGDATTIDGSLFANGIVYIVNPAGIFFGGDAVVEVGGLVAASGHISDEDFLSGVDRFELSGAVVNEGSLQGEVLALLGRRVENYGELSAPDGTIALVAGERVVLARLGGRVAVEVDGPAELTETVGIRQAGLVDAGAGQAIFAVGDHYSLAMNHEGVTRGGRVELRGGDEGVLLVRGEIDASGGEDESGGTIHVTGDRIALVGARLDASGGAGGGSIRVGGDLRGAGDLRVARRTYVDERSELLADATQSGDGGDVVVWGDEAAVMSGRISARGGALAGDGGFAEISSLGLLEADGLVDLGASAGATGTLLFDPQDIVIVGGTADGSDMPDGTPPEDQVVGDDGTLGTVMFDDVGDGSTPFEIYESELEGTDANVLLEARNSITTGGTFDDDIITMLDGNNLVMVTNNAPGDEAGSAFTPGIDLTGIDIVTSGGGNIGLQTGADAGNPGAMPGAEAAISVGNLNTSGGGGSASLDTDNGAISVGAIDTSGAGGDTGTNAGAILLGAGDADGSGDTSITVAGDLLAIGGDGADGNGGDGGTIDVRTREQTNSDPQAGGGPVTVMGMADSSGGDGVGTDANGGDAGGLVLVAAVAGDVEVGDLRAVGGDADAAGSGNGGAGGFLAAAAENGDTTTGAANSSGGDGGMDVDAPGLGGGAGDLTLQAGFGDDANGALTIMGAVRALDGATLDPATGGGDVNLRARDDIEFVGVGGTEITTGGDVTLVGNSVGANDTIEVDGRGTADSVLEVEVADTADLDITSAGFRLMRLRGTSNQATLDITQAAEKAGGNGVTIDIDGSASTNTVVRIDTTQVDSDTEDTVGAEIQVAYTLEDENFDADDLAEDLVLRVANGAVTAAGVVNLNSEDDVELEDGAIQMFEVLDPDAEVAEDAGTGASAGLQIIADFDSDFPDASNPDDRDGDGTGAIVALGGTAIDMNADGADESGLVALIGGAGVGSAGAEIVTANLGGLAAEVRQSGGIHVRNASGTGDVTLTVGAEAPNGIRVLDGDADGTIGDVEIVNDTGNLVVTVDVVANDEDVTAGGNVTLGAPAGEIRLADTGGQTLVEGVGDVTLDGPVVLEFNGQVSAGGNVVFSDTIDSDAAAGTFRALTVESGGTVSFGGDVGGGAALSRIAVTGDTVLDDDRMIEVLDSVSFGAIDSATPDMAGLTIIAGDGTIFPGSATFSGNIGENGRLSGLSVDTARVIFDADGDQSVETAAGGILLTRDLATVPTVATIGKQGGDLLLDTDGAIDFGENQKLTVAGVANLFGDERVTVGDANATAINVETALFEVRQRAGASFQQPGGGLLPDFGTELLADTISVDSPVVDFIGTGATPRFATLSGAIDGSAGGSVVGESLGQPIDPSSLVDDSGPGLPVFFDLGLSLSDPGNETEPDPQPLVDWLPALPGEQPSVGSASAPATDALQAFLECAEAEPGAPDCAADASPLDSPRGDDIARRYRRLFGDSPEARASREMLGGPERSERDAVLRDLATLLVQLRLLGMEMAEYEQVRDRLLDSARGDTPRDALLADLRTQSRGIPL